MRFRQALASCTVLGLSFADWGNVLVHVPAPAAWQLEGMLLAPQQAFAILVTPTEALVLTGRYPQDWTLTYFRSVPHSLYWPMWAISILAVACMRGSCPLQAVCLRQHCSLDSTVLAKRAKLFS